jgi:hypothetical protein
LDTFSARGKTGQVRSPGKNWQVISLDKIGQNGQARSDQFSGLVKADKFAALVKSGKTDQFSGLVKADKFAASVKLGKTDQFSALVKSDKFAGLVKSDKMDKPDRTSFSLGKIGKVHRLGKIGQPHFWFFFSFLCGSFFVLHLPFSFFFIYGTPLLDKERGRYWPQNTDWSGWRDEKRTRW